MSTPTSLHCTCCHVCHVSMKQRPRQVLACSDCNTIICRVCLETRWKTSQWLDDVDSWLCLKCRGECPCKSCKGRKQVHSTKRELVSEDEDEVDGREYFVAPSSSRATKRLNNLPGRQPSLPAGFQQMPSNNTQSHMPRDKIGLGMFLMDSGTPVHVKVLELGERKAHCEDTIQNVKGLLSMLEEERNAIDDAMKDLIKKTTTSVGQRLTRSNSQKSLEDLEFMSGGFARTGSSCNLEEMAAESLSKAATLSNNNNIF